MIASSNSSSRGRNEFKLFVNLARIGIVLKHDKKELSLNGQHDQYHQGHNLL